MNIYTIDGSVWLADVPITPSCEAVVELMKEDYVQLVWNADYNDVIPVGSYITYNGERYSLIEPYLPDQRTEKDYTYSPKFVSAYIGLMKVPFFMYTSGGGKEAEWSLTDNPANFMAVLCSAILTETGLKYSYAIGGDVVIASATCSFNCTSIQSAINEIANAFETEIWLEKYAQADANGNIGCLHLGKASHGTAVDLEVGTNIKVPSVTRNGEYFNRFYVFGSARNITQDYQGANVNNLATKRLTLDPTDYPNGYIDFSNGGPVFSKVLQFEDIYPAATDLVVMNIRAWLRYRRDESTSEKIQIGTDPVTGDPVYDQYAVWFVNLKRKVNGSYVDFTFNNTTYDKTENPTGMLLPALVPSLHFNSGPLAGREFEVIYHDTDETVKDGNDGLSFNILAGDFEIKYIEEGTYIIPAVTGLIPTTDNNVVLFNVMMPSSYVDDAYDRLEAAAFVEIAKNYLDPVTRDQVDKNSYQVESDPTVFSSNDPGLTIGRKVNYVNGTYEKESRVTKIVKKLDYPSKQTIVFGDEIIKGNIEELKEEAVSANRNIDILTALNKTTKELTSAYERTHQLVLKQLADQASLFLVQPDTSVMLNPIHSGLWTQGFLTAGGKGEGGGQGGGGSLASLADVTILSPQGGDILIFDPITLHWVNTPLTLNELNDVEIGTPTNGQVLMYDSTTGKWMPGTVSSSGTITINNADATIGTSQTTLATINGTAITAKIPTTLEANITIGTDQTNRNLVVKGNLSLTGDFYYYGAHLMSANPNTTLGTDASPWAAIYGTAIYEKSGNNMVALADKYQAKLPSGTTNGQVLTWNGSAWVAGNGGGSGEVNVINSISVNGTAQTPDANKNVNITVPTSLSQLSADATHLLVTDTEKNTWNGKQAALPNGTTSGQVLKWNGSAWVAGNAGTGGDVNVIESISVNGTNVAPDSNKNVDITIGAGVLTIKMNNASKGTFSANATSNAEIDLGTVVTSLTGYATQTWVSETALSGYATQTWVQQQGYLTSSALSGYATQTWVENKGYITSSALSGYATQTWVQQQGFLTAHQSLGLFAGQASGTSNYETSDPYIIITGGGTNKGAVRLKGAGTVTVSSDANGVVTITGSGSGPGTIPAADANTLGGIKLGFTSASRNFGVAVDENNRAYVSVPDTVVSVPSTVPTIGTSETTLGTVGGTTIKAKIASYLLASDFTAANIVSTLGTTAVNRATADASGNTITSSYLRKDTNDTMAGNLAIGTSSSSKKLTIYGTTSAALTIYGSTYSTNIYRDSSALQVSGAVSLGGTLDTTGSVTIGSSSSTSKKLILYGSTSAGIEIYGGSNGPTKLYRTSSALVITGSSGNAVNIGTSSISQDFKVFGNISATGNIVAGTASDRRLKKGIHTIKNDAVDVLWRLHPVTFEWNDTAGELGGLSGVSAGFIADEFNDIIPNATRKIWDEYDAIDYERVIPYLVAGWKAQQRCIHAMDKEIKELKRRLGNVVQ